MAACAGCGSFSVTSDAATSETEPPPATGGPIDPQVACAIDSVDPDNRPDQPPPPPNEVVVLADRDGVMLCVGPVLVAGDVIDSAVATPDVVGDWRIDLVFTEDGIDQFNDAAALCGSPPDDASLCPTMRLAIVDGATVITAPTIQSAEFERDQVAVSGNFDQAEAELLATRFQTGGLAIRPVLLELGP